MASASTSTRARSLPWWASPGRGKTTLGRAILGLQREKRGEILLDGKSVSGLAPEAARRARSTIQYVHQDAGAALDPWWNIGRTLAEGLLIHGVGDAADRRERVRAMLAAVGLDPESARRYPHEFSGGQLRRVSLARILLLQAARADPRRADVGPRHVGASDGAQFTAGFAETILPHLPVHFSRSVRRRALGRSHRHHAARPRSSRRARPRTCSRARHIPTRVNC